MNKLKRYDFYIGTEPYTEVEVIEEEYDVSGEWVRYEDYMEERKQLLKTLGCAVRYIDALEEAVESCGDVVSDAVWDNCPAIGYSHDRAKELCEEK